MKYWPRTISERKSEASASTRRRIEGRDDRAVIDKTDPKPNSCVAVPGSAPLSQHPTYELAALVEELLDAHLDTIELMSEPRPPNDSELSHLCYLKALYRYGQSTTAALRDGPGQTIAGA